MSSLRSFTYQLVVIYIVLQKVTSGVSLCKNSHSHLCKAGEVIKTSEENPSEMKTERNPLRHIMKKSAKEMVCQRGWFTLKSWKPKKLTRKNLSRPVCGDHWYVYSLKVFKEVGDCVSIRVSQWKWEPVTQVKHSVNRKRRGVLNVKRNKNVFKNNRLKGKRFLFFSKSSRFDKSNFRQRHNIIYNIPNDKYEKRTRDVLRKVSWLCSRL